METTKKYFTAAETAKAIRKELKATFPKIKFSVTSDSYTGGNSVSINYSNGVSVRKIEEVVKKYEYGTFDGMSDIYNYDNVNDEIPQVKYVLVSRDFTPEARQEMFEFVKTNYAGMDGLEYDDYYEAHGQYVNVIVRRLLCEKEF